MMVDILDPQEGETVYDPACGTGNMLLGSIEHVNMDLDTATSTLRDEMLRQQEEGLDAGRMWKTWIDIFRGSFNVTD